MNTWAKKEMGLEHVYNTEDYNFTVTDNLEYLY